jgi:guanine deaminase
MPNRKTGKGIGHAAAGLDDASRGLWGRVMERAIEEARRGIDAGDGGPFGAVIVRDGRLISRAHNQVLKTKDPTAHAEVLAIRKAAKRLGSHDLMGCVLFTTCEPCPMCLGAIAWARISSVVYGCTAADADRLGFGDRDIYAMMSRRKRARSASRPAPGAVSSASRIERQIPALVNLGRRECLALFAFWMQRPGHELY